MHLPVSTAHLGLRYSLIFVMNDLAVGYPEASARSAVLCGLDPIARKVHFIGDVDFAPGVQHFRVQEEPRHVMGCHVNLVLLLPAELGMLCRP